MASDDILAWARKYMLDSDGQPIKLAPWQEKLARQIWDAMEKGNPIYLNLPRRIR